MVKLTLIAVVNDLSPVCRVYRVLELLEVFRYFYPWHTEVRIEESDRVSTVHLLGWGGAEDERISTASDLRRTQEHGSERRASQDS